MKRFLFEISDSITSSPLADNKSIFVPAKLTEAEKTDSERNIELYSINCDFGYSIEVESLAGRTDCNRGDDCRNFCKTACGLDDSTLDMSILGTLTGNCGCNIEIIGDNFCQCKKFDEWQDTYRWKYGYTAGMKAGTFATATSQFPVGLSVDDSVLPAKMTLTAYDTFLTRIACITKKSYEIKDVYRMKFGKPSLYFTSSPVFERKNKGTHVCLYSQTPEGSEIPIDCRYMPDVPFERFRILSDIPASADGGTIIAYPLNRIATCNEAKTNPSLIAKKSEAVATVLLCSEAD